MCEPRNGKKLTSVVRGEGEVILFWDLAKGQHPHVQMADDRDICTMCSGLSLADGEQLLLVTTVLSSPHEVTLFICRALKEPGRFRRPLRHWQIL